MFFKKKVVEIKKEFDEKEAFLRGFECGFSKAWEWQKPYMQLAADKLKESLYQEAMNKALDDLEPTIQRRIKAIGH